MFSLPRPGSTDIWVIDFERLGWWLYAGEFDNLITRSDLRRDVFVPLSGTMVPATSVIAEEYIAIEIDDPAAAVAIRVPIAADADV